MDKTKYRISIKTGDIDKAGTDSDVHMILSGTNGKTERLVLNPLLEKDTFERGSLEIFDDVELSNVGGINGITIGHNNKHFFPGWYVEYIEVLDKSQNRLYKFPCHKWFAKDEGDGKIERTLLPETDLNKNAYFLTIKTGSMKDAGTDANVQIILHGEEGDSPKIILNPLMKGKVFRQGGVDQVMLENMEDLGFIKSITIGHDNKNWGPGWYLEKITVLHCDTRQVFEFDCFEWLSRDKGDKKVERTLYVNEVSEADTWNKRPVYAIAHMCNDKHMLIKAVDLGANAIECDIKIENPQAVDEEPYKFTVHHGPYPIIEYGMISTPIHEYLKDLKSLMPSLAMVMFDCKDSPGIDYIKYGRELCSIIMEHGIDPKLCVMSIPYLHMTDFFTGMRDVRFQGTTDISMFDNSPSDRHASYWLSMVEKYNCNILGMGVDAFEPFSPVNNWTEPLAYSSRKKHVNGKVKKVYYYTLNGIDSIKKVMDTGVDGIICNMRPREETIWEGLEGMLEVLKDNRYCFTHRLATPKDSLNEAFGYIENSLVCSKSAQDKKYFIRNGSKHLIPDDSTLANMRFNKPAWVMEDEAFAEIPCGEELAPLVSPLIKLADSEKIYIMYNGWRRYVQNDSVLKELGFDRNQAVPIPKEQMDKIWLNKGL